MAIKVRWTSRAIADRLNIYKYWLERNPSDSYPEKPESLFEKFPAFQKLEHLRITEKCTQQLSETITYLIA